MCTFAYSAGDCCHVRFSCVWKHICEGLLLSGGLSLLIPLLSSSSQVFPFVKNLSHHPSEPKLFQIQYVLPTISLFFCHQFFYSRASYACAETSPHTSHQILCHGVVRAKYLTDAKLEVWKSDTEPCCIHPVHVWEALDEETKPTDIRALLLRGIVSLFQCMEVRMDTYIFVCSMHGSKYGH